MSSLPPLPKIEGDVDLLLDVYTHSSLRFNTAPMNDDYGDTERLAELGAKVLDLVVTYHLYSIRPCLSANEIVIKREKAMSDNTIGYWLDQYQLKQKLRVAPGEEVDAPHELRRFFNTYVGALYVRNGMPTIQTWISRLIDPDADIALKFEPSHPVPQPNNQQWPTSPGGSQHWPSTPAPPPTTPPPVPPYSLGSPGSGNFSSLVSLALVNQTAAQKGFQITYPAEQTGPPHQPTWTVRCCLNGQERGQGVGKSQKIAKEEAARQAWIAMGWGPRS